MMDRRLAATVAALVLGCGGCGTAGMSGGAGGAGGALTGAGSGTSSAGTTSGASGSAATSGTSSAGTTSGASSSASTSGTSSGGTGGGGAVSAIRHVVVIVQENHTFDVHFGGYCTAPAGSSPSCTTGPSCCEAAPASDPSGAKPVTLDDAENAAYDPNHTQACELGEINGGAMDRFAAGASCSDARNFARSPAAVVQPYWDLAAQNAIADRYFQPIAGQSSSNDMYLAGARYLFTDTQYYPDTTGHGCTLGAFGPFKQYTDKTIGDVLLDAGLGFAFYAEGYAAMKASLTCPSAPSDCPLGLPTTPCDYDPSGIPFEYYQRFADNAAYMLDYDDFVAAVQAGTLPELSFIHGVGYHNEHPGYGTLLSSGVHFATGVVDAVMGSSLASDTLVLLTWDEGGGFFDHVAPPPPSTVDSQPYGTRVPLLAIGRFARKNHVSHVTLEHSSILAFVEYNFLHAVGQLGARDAVVHNLGSLLDPAQTGLIIPD